MDYDEYEECQNTSDPSKTNVYALFPFGSPYTRAYYMQEALRTGAFDDGGFVEGHRGADWHSRALSAAILAAGTDGTANAGSTAEMIYDYEVKIRTARKILNTSMDLSSKLSFAEDFLINGVANDTVQSFKALAEKEVQEELKEYTVRSPIVSVAAGIVTGAEYNCYSGFFAAVRHTVDDKTPVRTSYVHMRRWPTVQEGDIVGPGTVVGYEGTTGNSTGYHLHQNMDNDAENGTLGDSPAKYMAPIFTPFYNRDKVFETLGTIKNEWNGKQELIMGTEYMELIRTVLMYPMTANGTFDFDETWYLDKDAKMSTGTESLTFLLSCTTIRSGDEEYLNYSSGDNEKAGISDFYDGKREVVIKEGSMANPKYYKCEVETVIVPVTVDDDGNTKVVQEKRLKILPGTKEEFKFEEKTLHDGIGITVEIGTQENKKVVWGNNTPLTPLVDDLSKLIDVTVMSNLKKFDPWSERFAEEVTRQANNPPKDQNPNQVTANPDVFTPDQSRLSLPKWALLYMTEAESPYAVPFYDGPISIEMANNTASQYSYSTAYDTGYAGSLSGDLIALKKAIKARGLVSGDEIDVESAEYDEAFANLWKKVVNTPGYGDLASLGYAQNGNLGTYGAGDDGDQAGKHFSNWGVCIWNTIVTYGSVSDAQKAGKAAAEMGAIQLGVRPSWIKAVAGHESSWIPTAESHNFCAGRQDISFITNDSYPNEQPILGNANAVIEYKGVERTLRRAIGLMQLAPPYCLTWAAESGANNIDQMIAALRSPRSNAMIGATQLRNHMNSIIKDSSRYNKLRANVDANRATFDALCEGTGLSPYEMALMGCATLCYNRGYGIVDEVIDAMATIQYNSGSNTITGGKNLGYYRAVMCEIAEAERR